MRYTNDIFCSLLDKPGCHRILTLPNIILGQALGANNRSRIAHPPRPMLIHASSPTPTSLSNVTARLVSTENTLICLFSYNMGRTLAVALNSISAMCKGFDLVIFDDNSDDTETREIIDNNNITKRIFTSTTEKAGKTHGNLYENIRAAFDLALSGGYEFLYLTQDDIQFVRAFDKKTLNEYSEIYTANEEIVQIDPRFIIRKAGHSLTRSANGLYYESTPSLSYADVGLIDLSRWQALGCHLLDSERRSADTLRNLGFRRVFPFTPLMMHVPFPYSYRNGKKRRSLFPFRRGSYKYSYMSASEIIEMDSRTDSTPPYAKRFLRPSGMHLSYLYYLIAKEKSLYR